MNKFMATPMLCFAVHINVPWIGLRVGTSTKAIKESNRNVHTGPKEMWPLIYHLNTDLCPFKYVAVFFSCTITDVETRKTQEWMLMQIPKAEVYGSEYQFRCIWILCLKWHDVYIFVKTTYTHFVYSYNGFNITSILNETYLQTDTAYIFWDPFSRQGLILIPAWTGNDMYHKVYNITTCQFHNLNGWMLV